MTKNIFTNLKSKEALEHDVGKNFPGYSLRGDNSNNMHDKKCEESLNYYSLK